MSLKKIYALGIGHNTPVSLDLALACDYVVEGLFHFEEGRTGDVDHGFQVLGSYADLFGRESLKGMNFLLTMGDNRIRADLVSRILAKGGCVPTLIHPTAVISHFANISETGVSIYPFSYVQADSVVGRNTVILSHVNISHNVTIGENCFFAGGSTIGAYANVCDNVFVGQGALVISSKVKCIGKNAFIGARSLVTKDVPENAVVAGSPAQVIKMNENVIK